MLDTDAAWSQIEGKREAQEDSAAIVTWPNGFKLLLLADGMGGHVGGEHASNLVIECFRHHFQSSDQEDMRQRMLDALYFSNEQLRNASAQQPELDGMGTTLIAMIFDGLCAQWVSVGDSPLWFIRNGSIKRINTDHSMAQVLAAKVAKGEITAEEARTSPLRSQLLSVVMGEPLQLIDAPEATLSLIAGDCLLLASDGVETCSETEIADLVQLHFSSGAASIATHILQAVEAADRRGQDNASLIALRILGSIETEAVTVVPDKRETTAENKCT